MKIIVTGSEGNIGSKLVPYLEKKGHNVYCVDQVQKYRNNYIISDIMNPVDMFSIVNDFKPDAIIHLAAMVSRITCEKSAGITINSNLTGLNNIINLCKINDSKLIYFSTSEIYGNIGGVLKEDRLDIEPNNRYGLTKYLGEKIVEYEVKYHGLKAVTVRPFMFYDEDENFGENRSAMIRFVESLLKDEKIEVHKNAKRGWTHIDDAVILIEKTLYLDEYNVINIASREVVDMDDFAKMICNILNKDYNKLVDVIEQPKQMTLEKIPYVDNMIKLLGYEPQVTLEDGLNRVIEKVKKRLNN